jgi:hypothetical protein
MKGTRYRKEPRVSIRGDVAPLLDDQRHTAVQGPLFETWFLVLYVPVLKRIRFRRFASALIRQYLTLPALEIKINSTYAVDLQKKMGASGFCWLAEIGMGYPMKVSQRRGISRMK